MASGLPTPKGWDGPSKTDWTYPESKKSYTPPPRTLESFFNDMFFLGFNDQLSRWASLSNMTKPSSFPPYNLVKINDDAYKIEIAIAGYKIGRAHV